MAYRIAVNDWTKISVETARFLFQQAETMLQTTVDTSTSMAARVVTMLQILFVAIGADLGYLLAKLETVEKYVYSLDVQAFGLALVVLCVAFYQAFKMYELVPVADKGSEPKKLATENLLMTIVQYQELAVLLNEIEEYQDRIELNLVENRRKAGQFKLVVNILRWGALAVVVFATTSLLCQIR